MDDEIVTSPTGDVGEWSSARDSAWLRLVMPVVNATVGRYFRSEVDGAENFPRSNALIVSNHSGGVMAVDVPIIFSAFFRRHGFEPPLYVLSHDLLLIGPSRAVAERLGFLPARKDVALAALRSGGVALVFPGGDYDAYRPTLSDDHIDFGGRTGYVRTALEANVPIVPVVSHGGQEAQLFLGRIEWIASLMRLDKLIRTKYLPVTVGLPFGVTLGFPPNFPLPTKIVTRVLPPIDLTAEFGPSPDVTKVDEEVRRRMQSALDDLARRRRFPVIG